ncbi:hypothetical protein DEH69_19355 [Streptomyces sp. PT12]|nr:hypothetical protein DEH69_19355 [Streptomyces sp. PT12]
MVHRGVVHRGVAALGGRRSLTPRTAAKRQGQRHGKPRRDPRREPSSPHGHPQHTDTSSTDNQQHGHRPAIRRARRTRGTRRATSYGRGRAEEARSRDRSHDGVVLLAAEWGHGRRTGSLSNLRLGARTADGSFAMLGKTFKGMTDAVLAWQTERLRELAVDDSGGVVTVRPELVVEVAFDGVQRSTRYPAGVTLRCARLVRRRSDKTPGQADTLDAVRALRTNE